MKVNPTSTQGGGGADEKQLQASKMGASTASLQSLGRSKASGGKKRKINCNKILKKIVEGKYWIIMMSIVTLFALFGVSS